jgi:hypothetical protein
LKAEKVYWLQSVAAVEVSLAPADRGGQLSHVENRLLMLHANREGNQDLRIVEKIIFHPFSTTCNRVRLPENLLLSRLWRCDWIDTILRGCL